MTSRPKSLALRSAVTTRPIASGTDARAFRSACPPDTKINVSDITDFRRGRGDLVFSLFMAALAQLSQRVMDGLNMDAARCA